MFRGSQVQNRICFEREVERNQKIHRGRLVQLRSKADRLLDNAAPRVHQHLMVNRKREQLELERRAEMDRDNRHLVEKMYTIKNRDCSTSHPSREFGPGMRLGMDMSPRLDCFHSDLPGPGKRSLNIGRRLRDYTRIAEENSAILTRIEAQKPYYDSRKWSADRARQKQYLHVLKKNTTSGFLTASPRSRRMVAAHGGGDQSAHTAPMPGPSERGGDFDMTPHPPGEPLAIGADADARAHARVMADWSRGPTTPPEWNCAAMSDLEQARRTSSLALPRRPTGKVRKALNAGRRRRQGRRSKRSPAKKNTDTQQFGATLNSSRGMVPPPPHEAFAVSDLRPVSRSNSMGPTLLFKVRLLSVLRAGVQRAVWLPRGRRSRNGWGSGCYGVARGR